MSSNALLYYLLDELTEWPQEGGYVAQHGYIQYESIEDNHGRVVFITLYPEEPEMVTYDMWNKLKSSQEMREMFLELDFHLDPDDVSKAERVLAEYGYTKN